MDDIAGMERRMEKNTFEKLGDEDDEGEKMAGKGRGESAARARLATT